jgi:hypothetical protein
VMLCKISNSMPVFTDISNSAASVVLHGLCAVVLVQSAVGTN